MTKSRNIRESRESERPGQPTPEEQDVVSRGSSCSTRGFPAPLNPRRVALRALALAPTRKTLCPSSSWIILDRLPNSNFEYASLEFRGFRINYLEGCVDEIFPTFSTELFSEIRNLTHLRVIRFSTRGSRINYLEFIISDMKSRK